MPKVARRFNGGSRSHGSENTSVLHLYLLKTSDSSVCKSPVHVLLEVEFDVFTFKFMWYMVQCSTLKKKILKERKLNLFTFVPQITYWCYCYIYRLYMECCFEEEDEVDIQNKWTETNAVADHECFSVW
jgi:hypothetical protein